MAAISTTLAAVGLGVAAAAAGASTGVQVAAANSQAKRARQLADEQRRQQRQMLQQAEQGDAAARLDRQRVASQATAKDRRRSGLGAAGSTMAGGSGSVGSGNQLGVAGPNFSGTGKTLLGS